MAGVARARNKGIAEARGELVAPCDADDLWSPDKLASQLAVFRSSGSDIGLVYCWTAVINQHDMVMNYDSHPSDSGWVFDRMCKGNLIGNGSACLMSKQAVLDAGGYDASLRDQNAQGCEDFKLYLRISQSHTFGVVPAYAVGYRHTDGNMSSDIDQMLRSYDIVIDEVAKQRPEKTTELRNGRAELIDWFRLKALNNQRWLEFFGLQIRLMRYDFKFAIKSIRWGILRPVYSQLKWAILKHIRKRPLAPGEIVPGEHKFIGPEGSSALHTVGKWPMGGAAISREVITQPIDKVL